MRSKRTVERAVYASASGGPDVWEGREGSSERLRAWMPLPAGGGELGTRVGDRGAHVDAHIARGCDQRVYQRV